MLQAAENAINPRKRQLLVKLAENAKAGGADINIAGIRSSTIIQQLDAFIKATSTSILTDVNVPLWGQQVYLEVLGDDLGPRILEVLDQQKAAIAKESTPSVTAPPSPPPAPGTVPPLEEVEVPSEDTIAEQEEFLAQMANNDVHPWCSNQSRIRL